MISSLLYRGGMSILPTGVPALNALFALILLLYFDDDTYEKYVYFTALITVIFLLSNMGVKLSLVRVNDCNSNKDAFIKISRVLLTFNLVVFLLSQLYGFFQDGNIWVLLLLGSLNLLLMDSFLAFNNSKGRLLKGYFWFAIGPRLSFYVLFLMLLYFKYDLLLVYCICLVLSLLFMVIPVIHEQATSSCHNPISPFEFKKPFEMIGEWAQIALYGLFTPGLIVYAEHFDNNMVRTIGIILMISQPFTILYQGSISLNLHQIKKDAQGVGERSLSTNTYKFISRVGILGAILHFALVIFGYLLFVDSDLNSLVGNPVVSVAVLIFSSIYVNSIFGPNGTLLGLLGLSYFDAYLALVKIVAVAVAAFVWIDVEVLLFTALLSEVVGNCVKNIYLGKIFKEDAFFTLKPLLISLTIIAISYYIYV